AGGASPHWTPETPMVIGTIMDVTDRLMAVEAPQSADPALSSMVGTRRWGMRLQAVRASPEGLRSLGLTADGAVREPDRNAFIHPEDRDRVRRTYEQARQNNTAFKHRYRILRPSGEIRYVEEDGHPKEQGIFESRIADITDRTRLERAL